MSTCVIQAQNVITVSNKSIIYLDLTQTYNPGLSKKIITNTSQWLNYTTLVHPSDPKISITVEVVSGIVPEGMELMVEASPYVGMSKSKQGNPIGKVSISHTPRVLINNIGTCYTGSRRNEGHQITYSFIITDYAKVRSGLTNLYIQYTITQY
ncbi:MAG: hypothetical protein QM487_04420 [Candidatus Marithrix sp.]